MGVCRCRVIFPWQIDYANRHSINPNVGKRHLFQMHEEYVTIMAHGYIWEVLVLLSHTRLALLIILTLNVKTSSIRNDQTFE